MTPTTRRALFLLPLAAALAPSRAHATNTLHITSAQLDRPTLVALGVQVLITDDDNFNAAITVRYRVTGTSTWQTAQPLFRVHAEVVTGATVPPSFAGSIFDLRPATAYEIELHATDPDGPVDTTMMLTGSTRPVPPANPAAPHVMNVTDAASLASAFGAAHAGDVITLANGSYNGTFMLNASGTADNPIFVRGASEDGVIIDGGNCTGCNAIEVYGSYVTIEQLTIQNVERAVRWQTTGSQNNVLRRTHVRNVTVGIGGHGGQLDFYVCDNIVEGRLMWPLTYGSDGAAHANDDGLVVTGDGMVVCHNRISGFADSLQNAEHASRANDFYGNDSIWNYDDGIELDEMAGNARCFRNRWTNTFDAISTQPVYGGPAYVFRNVIVNVAGESFKFHSEGSDPPSGVLAYHNTVVRYDHAFQLSTPAVIRYYAMENNLQIGPASPTGGVVVNWDTPIDFTTGTIDYNGWAPDGMFHFGYGPTGMNYASFTALMASGRYEMHGVLASGSNFASGLAAPTDYMPLMMPQDVSLASSSMAIDRGRVLDNIDDGFHGSAPDLGAIEFGCAAPTYGPRPMGVDESNETFGCATAPGGDGGVTDASSDAIARDATTDARDVGVDSGSTGRTSGGCGCATVPARSGSLVVVLVMAAMGVARRRVRSSEA